MVSKRNDSKYRSGPSTNWLKAKCYTVEEYELLGVEREPGKPAFALMADRKTGQYVGSAFSRAAMEARSGACRASAEWHEAAGNAVGQARHHRTCEALARRGGFAARFVAGFSRGRRWRSLRSIAPAHRGASIACAISHEHSRKGSQKEKPRRCAGAIYLACRRTRTCSSDRRERCGRGL